MDMDINSVQIMKEIIQCRNLSMKKIIYLFYIYFIQIFEVYNITQLSDLVGLYFLIQTDVLCFSFMSAVAVAVRTFKLLSSHSERSLSNSWYVSSVFWLSSEKIQSSAEILRVRQI